MKRIVTFVLTLCLCLSLTACVRSNPYVFFDTAILFDIDTIPDYSDNFDEEFFEAFEDDYVYADNLAYYSASEWEVEEEDDLNARVKYRFSVIDGCEDMSFVARSIVNRSKFPALADVICHLEVYRRKDAPDPMTDWTIKSISVLALDNLQDINSTSYETDTDLRSVKATDGETYVTMEELYVDYMSLFDTDERRICTFDRESDPKLMEMVKEGYANPIRPDNFRLLEIYPTANLTRSYDCYAVIRFEESDNIVWYCPLYKSYDSTELYLITSKAVNNEKFAVIDGEYAEKIFDAIKERSDNEQIN